jgi:predicted lipoprotein with Yx(FWY)xxD motif
VRKRILAVFGVVSIALLGACGDDDSDTTTTPAATSPATTAAATTTTAAAVTTTTAAVTTTAAATATVKLSDSKFGRILTDDAGRTLYLFTNDVKGKSNCAGACMTNWPVYAPATIGAGAGIDASKLASIDTAGKKQVTIDGVPLYYFSGDTKAGDTNGQGVGGIWFVVDATGKAIT